MGFRPLDVETPDPDDCYNCLDADVSLFFDDMHPTTVAHELIAERALELIDGQIIETEYAD